MGFQLYRHNQHRSESGSVLPIDSSKKEQYSMNDSKDKKSNSQNGVHLGNLQIFQNLYVIHLYPS